LTGEGPARPPAADVARIETLEQQPDYGNSRTTAERFLR
jgi:hypothetical protein